MAKAGKVRQLIFILISTWIFKKWWFKLPSLLNRLRKRDHHTTQSDERAVLKIHICGHKSKEGSLMEEMLGVGTAQAATSTNGCLKLNLGDYAFMLSAPSEFLFLSCRPPRKWKGPRWEQKAEVVPESQALHQVGRLDPCDTAEHPGSTHTQRGKEGVLRRCSRVQEAKDTEGPWKLATRQNCYHPEA